MEKKSGARLYMNNTLKAVHDDDVQHLLQSLNVFELVTQGKCRCISCGQIISLDNLAAIVPNNHEIQFICNNDRCYSELLLAEEEPDA